MSFRNIGYYKEVLLAVKLDLESNSGGLFILTDLDIACVQPPDSNLRFADCEVSVRSAQNS